MSIICKNCNASKYVRNGFVNGVQRYRCKECGINFVEGDKRRKYTLLDRLKVIKLYLENCGTRTIECLTGIHNSQIYAATDIKAQLQKSQSSINSIQDISILELDELCTYIKKDQKIVENLPLYGLLLIENRVRLLILR